MTIIAKQLVIILMMACSCSIAVAQNQHVYGKVLDKETHIPISDANISFTGTKLGCSTGQNGEFSLYIDTLPGHMMVSHLGYETRRIWLDKSAAGITILMNPVASMLKEVEIKAKSKPEAFFKDDQYSVLDYEVDSNLVYLLIYRFRMAKSELLCKSINGDTVARSGTFSFKPTGLFIDCLGYLHVLSNDSAYQVHREKETLSLCYTYDIQHFRSTLQDCVGSTDELLFFRKESSDHQTVEFYHINRKTSQKQFLASVRDEAKINMLRQNSMDYYFLRMDTIPDGNEYLTEWVWIKKILYKPNASVLYKIGDTLSVFNTTNGNLDLYDINGQLIRSLTTRILKIGEKDWTKEIYIDLCTHLPYTSFLKNGKLTLYRIDLFTGQLNRMLSTDQIFPQKVKVHHNFLFYLYDLPGTGDNKRLFRQKIDN